MNLLSDTGCDELQGFLFSRPVSAEKLKDLASLNGPENGQNETEKRPEHLALAS